MSRQLKEPEIGGGRRIPCRNDEMRSVRRNGGPPEQPRGVADLGRRIARTHQKQRTAMVGLRSAEYRIDRIADRATDDRGQSAGRHPRLTVVFFFNDTPTTEIYTLSLHGALRICGVADLGRRIAAR